MPSITGGLVKGKGGEKEARYLKLETGKTKGEKTTLSSFGKVPVKNKVKKGKRN